MLKVLVFGAAVAIAAAPGCAQAAEYSCMMTASEQQAFINLGYPQNAQQVMHVIVDQNAGGVTVWETSPDFPDANRSTYKASFTGSVASWTIPGDEDVGAAYGSVDTDSNILTTTDPNGDATQWNCSVN